jgi:flap endonuclease-1
LVKKEGTLDAALATLDKEKLPEGCDYKEVRSLFTACEVADPASVDLKWVDPDEEGIKRFLIEEKGFSAARVESGIAKLKKARTAGSQMRMDSFFKMAAPSAVPAKAGAGAGVGAKRKVRLETHRGQRCETRRGQRWTRAA